MMRAGSKSGMRERRSLSAQLRQAEAAVQASPVAHDDASLEARGTALLNLGEALFSLGRLAEAVDRLGQAGELLRFVRADQAVLAYWRQSTTLLALHRYDEVLQVRELVNTLMDRTPVARVMLDTTALSRVISLEELGRSVEAYEAAERLIEKHRSSSVLEDQHLVVRTLLVQTTVARSLGRFDLAQAAVAAAIELCEADEDRRFADEFAEAMVKRGLLFEEAGELEQAKAAYADILARFEHAHKGQFTKAVNQALRRTEALDAKTRGQFDDR